MVLKYIFLTFINFIFSSTWELDEIQYLIYTDNRFINSAELLSNLHENEVLEQHKLKTKIVLHDSLKTSINQFIFSNFIQENNEFINLKYLVIIGDETVISPILSFSGNPCDDCFSSVIPSNPDPKLITGRILCANDNQASNIINNIRNYSLNPFEGSWKSDMILLSDDQFKSGATIRNEKWHTLHSNKIYDSLKSYMNINCIYGPMFERQQSIDWFTQPSLTEKLIQDINKGLGLINYIGHGTSEFLADEAILTFSDIDLIAINNNKLPIWVVGTCSFGNYLNQNCLAEKILTQGNAGIAVISTTAGVSDLSNFNYLKNFFIENLKNILNNENDNKRIGDLFFESKGNLYAADKFHLFGDPAMQINLSTNNYNLLPENLENISIGTPNKISVDNNGLSTLRISNNDQSIIYTYDYSGDNYNTNDSCFNASFNYSCMDEFQFFFNGDGLYLEEFYNSTDYVLPIDAYQLKSVIIKLHNDYQNTIQIMDNINLIINDTEIINDGRGPNITLSQNNVNISDKDYDSSIIYPPYNFQILIDDELPINISGLNYHDIRLWIDNNSSESIILNDLYISSSDNNGYYGYINFLLPQDYIKNGSAIINIEAWDIMNNRGYSTYNVFFSEYSNSVYNVYNFPNPFKNETNFTFSCINSSQIYSKINLYTLDGNKIYSRYDDLGYNNNHFYQIKWDGNTNQGLEIPNGIYIYELEIFDNNNSSLHKGIYKLAKSK
jgi:hypothetical protein